MARADSMFVVSTAVEYNDLHQQWGGKTIALVPTMGALHEGHMALVRLARSLADVVVVSLFVNPLQFGPQEDLSQYPRPLEQDLTICRELGVDVVFTPTVETMYPDGLANGTTVIPPEILTRMLCGEFRPGHFTGVATVVLKLFNLLRPDWAIFGEKDAQQLAVIRKVVKDLHIPVTIVPHPTVRDAQGLALSSRNRYLKTDVEKQAAQSLSRILSEIRNRVRAAKAPLLSERILNEVSQTVLVELEDSVNIRLQYLQAVDKETFAPVEQLGPGVKVLIAAYVNDVRLIDNMDLD